MLDPRVALDFSSASLGLQEPTQAQRQQLRADHEVVAALCRKMGMRSCKEMREAKHVDWRHIDRSATDLAMLGKLSSVLPALERLYLSGSTVGVLRLAAELGTRALPAVTTLAFSRTRVGDAGASALAAALGRGALPRLKTLTLNDAAIGDAGLVALAPALRLRPALEALDLSDNPLGDKGLAATLAGALSPPTGVLAKLKRLYLGSTQITDAGCATLISALDNGALPALESFSLGCASASTAAQEAVRAALARSRAAVPSSSRPPPRALAC